MLGKHHLPCLSISAAVTLILLMVAAGLHSCGTASSYDSADCVINQVVTDTLFIKFKDAEDEMVFVRIQRNDIDFTGREQVADGQVYFDIRSFPSGYYTLWIKVGPEFVCKRFFKR